MNSRIRLSVVWASILSIAMATLGVTAPAHAATAPMTGRVTQSGVPSQGANDKPDVASADDVKAGVVANADLAPAKITGTVTESGAPSAGASVTLYQSGLQDPGWFNVSTATTDAAGRYAFELASSTRPDETFRVGFEKEGWRSEYFNDKPTVDEGQDLRPGDVANADLASARITGTVTESGAPSTGARVAVQMYAGQYYGRDLWYFGPSDMTDSEGRFEILLARDDPVDAIYRVFFSKDGWRDEYYNDKPDLASADNVKAGAVANADLSPAALITGRVTADGEPLHSATVKLYRREGGEWVFLRSAQTSPDKPFAGEYRFSLPGGEPPGETYRIGFEKKGWRTEYYNDRPTLAAADDLKPGAVANAELTREGKNEGTPLPEKMLPKKVRLYSAFASRKAWLRASEVRLPGKTTQGRVVRYGTRAPKVCQVAKAKGIWRIKGKKVGTCAIRARATPSPSVTFQVSITKK